MSSSGTLDVDSGDSPVPDPLRDEQWVRRLFEKAIAGFYKHSLSSDYFRVKTGTLLNWPVSAKSESLRAVFPSMRADIVIDDLAKGRQLVLDTNSTKY